MLKHQWARMPVNESCQGGGMGDAAPSKGAGMHAPDAGSSPAPDTEWDNGDSWIEWGQRFNEWPDDARFAYIESCRHLAEQCKATYDALISLGALVRQLESIGGYTTHEQQAELRQARLVLSQGGVPEEMQRAHERWVSRQDGCWCIACEPPGRLRDRMTVCPACHNKRCPHASDHSLACTGSNEPGQEGSVY